MTRDSRSIRLDRWPRLATFPTTTATAVSVIALTWATWIGIMLERVFPESWFLFLGALAAGSITQFGIKRKTEWRTDNGTGAPPGDNYPPAGGAP